jgi:prepilin-type N-terminal cleavage/methylation domain-containing protein
MRKRHSGFTLIELLLAAAIMGVILTALSGLFVSTTRAYRANEDISERQQNMEAATQLLKYEIALAGYRGTDVNSSSASRKLSGSSLTVIPGSGSAPDILTIRYYEDRPPHSPESPELQVVTYSVDKNSNNVWNLYRQQGTASQAKQPAVEGVTNLKVTEYRLKNGAASASMPSKIEDLAGMTLRLTFVNGEMRTTTISLPSLQCRAPTPPCNSND